MQCENHTDVLDQALQDIESEESGNIVAPNAQYRGDIHTLFDLSKRGVLRTN